MFAIHVFETRKEINVDPKKKHEISHTGKQDPGYFVVSVVCMYRSTI